MGDTMFGLKMKLIVHYLLMLMYMAYASKIPSLAELEGILDRAITATGLLIDDGGMLKTISLLLSVLFDSLNAVYI